MLKVIILLLVFASAHATETSPKAKVEMHKSCMATCVPNQRAMPENKFLEDVPFVLNTYCSCACTRLAMRVSLEKLSKIGALALKGKGAEKILREDPELQEIMEKSGSKCLTALMDEDE